MQAGKATFAVGRHRVGGATLPSAGMESPFSGNVAEDWLWSRIAVGIPVTRYPRSDPSERNSRTGLPPWVSDGEALVGPRMKDARLRKPGVGDLRDPYPRQVVLLATTPKRTTPVVSDVVTEYTECLSVRGHRVVRKEAGD